MTRRLLLVEDDPATYNALKGIFSRRGWDVVVAPSLAKALSHVPEGFDTIILDLMLPDGDGIAVLRQIRSLKLSSRVIVPTRINDQQRLDAVNALQPDAILHKPIDIHALQSLMNT